MGRGGALPRTTLLSRDELRELARRHNMPYWSESGKADMLAWMKKWYPAELEAAEKLKDKILHEPLPAAPEKCGNELWVQDHKAVWRCNKRAGHEGEHAYQTPFGEAIVRWAA